MLIVITIVTVTVIVTTIIIDAIMILVQRKKEDVIVKVFAMAVTVRIAVGIMTIIVAVSLEKQAGIRFSGPAFLHIVDHIIF
jgi:type III secretory pathway component EscT